MKKLLLLMLCVVGVQAANECIVCHKGIEDIRDPNSKMMQAIYKKALKAGHKGNDCIVCHGGDPEAKTKKAAHRGTINYFLTHKGPKTFYSAPSSPWINKNTCGMCHEEQVKAQMNSLMMTEQGKIQGTLWSFGAMNGYKHDIGNYATHNPSDPHSRLGTKAYQEYMHKLSKLEPQAFPKKMKELPPAPTAKQVQRDPKLAAYTYLRQECLRCHTGAKGRKKWGDYRGIGCASCHIPYSNSGVYEGNDPMISKKRAGHLLVHRIQSSRKVKVQVHDINYSGVPVETCTTCHNRGKRIGVSYQGLMETAYNATFDAHGKGQGKLHTKRYLHMKSDIHYQKGMLCQDCHTSNDLHGDGFLAGATLGAVEIECQDCHGTTRAYPWELPLGYSDEFSTKAAKGKARGVTLSMPEYLKQGTVYDKKDGYLLSARGNPLTNVVRQGRDIIVHLASGKDIRLEPLKKLAEEEKLSAHAMTAMDRIEAHTQKLECYTCHATWAPQCYGCHISIDYSAGKKGVDWLAASHDHDRHGRTGDMKNIKKYLIDGKVTETRSYLRWEDPALSQNGEGRISPTVPGCQTTITVIGKYGKPLLQNHIFKIPNVEGAGKKGQNAIDMAPIQPHTISKESRSCESCHANDKALGLGIRSGKDRGDLSQDLIVDLMTADKKVIPSKHRVQVHKIPNLKDDWSRFIDENGTQLQTVGHHFKLSAPLNRAQREKLDRRGVCLSCHKSIPEADVAVSLLSHVAKYANISIDSKMHQSILNKGLKLSAWVQVLGVALVMMLLFYLFGRKKRSKRRRRF